MPELYDTLIRFGLDPANDFEFNKEDDSLMRVRKEGVRKLVKKHYFIKMRNLHVSMIPNDNGVVETALVSLAAGVKQPGVWHVILDSTGRPVAEHPLTYSNRNMEAHEPDAGKNSDHSAAGNQAVKHELITTGDLARTLVSWLVGYDRVNDDDSAKILEILSVHALSPRTITIEIKTRNIAQRLHDELLCLEDDVAGIPEVADQAASLREKVALLLIGDRL